MNHRVCVTLNSIHLLALALCTYIATVEIESILVTGWICSVTGIAAGVSASKCQRPFLAFVGWLTPIIAVNLFWLEAFMLNLGPRKAALPFSIVLLINQALATVTILVQIKMLTSPAGVHHKQFTIQTLLVATTGLCIYFAFARYLVNRQHDWTMVLALGLLGLSLVGLGVVLYQARVKRGRAEISA